MILQISSTQLSRGMLSDDVACVQQVPQAFGRGAPADETADRVLGAGTVAVVKGLQTELGGRFRHQQCQDLPRRLMTSLPNLTLIHEWFVERCATQTLTNGFPFFVECRNKEVIITSREGN
jgi:hypothetical protein